MIPKTNCMTPKIDNATSAASKNNFIDKKISNIYNRKKAYNTAVKTDTANFNRAKKALNKFKSAGTNTSVLKSVQKYSKAGKRIPDSVLKKAYDLNDNGKLYQACIQYNEYYDAKTSDKMAADLYAETSKQDKADLGKEKFHNIADKYDHSISSNEQKKTAIQNQISLAEEQGQSISKNYYKNLISAESGEQQKLIRERAELQKSLNEAVANGSIKKNSDEWYEMVNLINEITNAIDESTQSLAEYKNAMRQLEWDAFDDAIETVGRVNSESDYYISLMGNKQLVDKDNGDFTEYGKATLGLHQKNIETYLSQADAYEQEYNSIMAQIEKGELSLSDQNVVDRLRELEDARRDAALSAENEKQSVVDLVREGYEAQLSALSNLIQKYKDLKNSEKDAYEYSRKIQESVKNISSLQKQLAALGQNDTEESQAQIQKLRVQLQDAENDLKDTEYEKYLSDSSDMLDEMYGRYEEFIDEKLSNTDAILSSINETLGDKGSIVATLKALDSNLTSTLSNIITGQNVSGYVNTTVAGEKAAVEAPVSTSSYSAEENASSAVAEKKKTDQINLVKDYINKYGTKATRKKKEYSDVNQVLYSSFGKLVLTGKEMKELADKLGIKYNNATKNGNLYKKLKELGIKGFKTGSNNIPYNQVALLSEEGSELQFDKSKGVMKQVGQGDMIWTNEMSENLWKLSQVNPNLLMGNMNFTPVKIPDFENNIQDKQSVSIEIGDIVMNGVNDAETFGRQLRDEICKNGKTTQCIVEAVSAKQLGWSGVGNARLYQ